MNDFQLAVTGHACTGRNQLADDDVFLQTEEWIFLALIAASVRTRVVSWKDAAERKESVARAAFVVPRSS